MNGYNGNKNVGIIFSGGPAPSANAVISSAALSFINKNIPIFGFIHGFEFLENYDSKNRFSLIENTHYLLLDHRISGIRNRRGVFLKTSRANPGKHIKTKEDLKDPQKNKKLCNILAALDSLDIGFLVTIGGDDTLKTANFLHLMGLPVIHIPKTIDNDYFGIAWTFGYWTAVQTAKEGLLNLKGDAESTDAYFIVELMGRKAGWITYAAGIAGESVMMLASEDFDEDVISVDAIAKRIVDMMIQREKQNKYYGVICVSEGLVDKLPKDLRPTQTDRHGNIMMGAAEIGKLLRNAAQEQFLERTGRKKKIVSRQIGYETRSVPPISFDVVLGSMLGFGAYKLYNKEKFGSMVSVSNHFDIIDVPFTELIDEKTMLTKLRGVPKGSDFFELKQALSF